MLPSKDDPTAGFVLVLVALVLGVVIFTHILSYLPLEVAR